MWLLATVCAVIVSQAGAGGREGASAPSAAASSGAHASSAAPAQGAAPAAAATIGALIPAASAFPALSLAAASALPESLDFRVLSLALQSTTCAMGRGAIERRPSTLTVIDYSRPSTMPRLWVLDLDTGTVLFEEHVAHGRGSGENLATRFSNTPDSHQSSLGLFVTDEPYVGKHGLSLRLDGLEPGVNDRARERAIVMHGASYVDPRLGASLGRLGRSWGCPALRPEVTRQVIDRIRGGNVLFAYYPDRDWLASSVFLNGCGS